MAPPPNASETSASLQKTGALVRVMQLLGWTPRFWMQRNIQQGAPSTALDVALCLKLKSYHTGCLIAGIYDERRYQANGHASPRSHTPPKSARGHLVATEPDDRDSGMVECPCGVTCDDGQAMIECERCKVRTQQDRAHGNCEVMASKRYAVFAWFKRLQPRLIPG